VSVACKRLRKRGQGQSAIFCAPLELQSKMLEYSGKKEAKLIEVEDVLLWTMRNSWGFTKNGMPLWATQGMRHYGRRAACDLSSLVLRVQVGILEPEALALGERYGLDRQLIDERVVCRNRIQVDNDVMRVELCSIRAKCREFGLSSFGDPTYTRNRRESFNRNMNASNRLSYLFPRRRTSTLCMPTYDNASLRVSSLPTRVLQKLSISFVVPVLERGSTWMVGPKIYSCREISSLL